MFPTVSLSFGAACQIGRKPPVAHVLMIISAADTLILADSTGQPTGYWAEEVAASHEALVQAGLTVELATPSGKRPTVDGLSLSEAGGVGPAESERFKRYLAQISKDLESPLSVAEVDLSTFDAIYLPGGHAPMADLAEDHDLARLLTQAQRDGKPVAALCHGVSALLSTRQQDPWPYAGLRMTGFTDAEEEQGGYGDRIPFSVEAELREAGGNFEAGDPWTDKVVVDGTLITGQNPQSSLSTAKALITALTS